jgi:hypothetical protein
MPTLAQLIARTEQKISYARLILDELEPHPSRHTGDSFERSHIEAFLFHFYGVVDAFLQEINAERRCGLALENVTRRTLRERLASLQITSREFDAVNTLEATPDSYLALAKEMRHFVTHRGGLPMAHYFNGPTNLVHPVTRNEFSVDSIELLRSWLSELETLLHGLRSLRSDA